MTRYTPPRKHHAPMRVDEAKKSVRWWSITWNVLLTLLAVSCMLMTTLNHWFSIAVLILAPGTYFGFMQEEKLRGQAGLPPRYQRSKELRWMLAVAFTLTSFYLFV